MARNLALGLKHLEGQRFALAETEFRRALKKDPGNPDIEHLIGVAQCQMNRTAEGLARMRAALARTPRDPRRWWAYAVFAYYAGEREVAARAIRRAAELAPDDLVLLYNYCNLVRPAPSDPIVLRLEALRAGGTLCGEALSRVLYALSYVADAAGAHERAMDLALEAGALYGVTCNLDPHSVERILRANTPEALRRRPCGGDPTEAPVFILGMPRSGTTLTEQILGCHPDVFAAGELSGGRTAELLFMSWAQQNLRIGDVYEAVARVPPAVETVAAEHLMGLVRNLAPGRGFRRFTDKLPENVFRVGILGRMFPNARIVVLRRHPLDSCVSCLLNRFNDIQYSFTNTIPALAAQYIAYEKALAHWKRVSPLAIHELRYESLVAEPEPEIRRLLDFLGLPWDPACLAPERHARTVRTASAVQVREAINARAVGRWRRYASRLGPLIEALGGMERIEAWAAGVA